MTEAYFPHVRPTNLLYQAFTEANIERLEMPQSRYVKFLWQHWRWMQGIWEASVRDEGFLFSIPLSPHVHLFPKNIILFFLLYHGYQSPKLQGSTVSQLGFYFCWSLSSSWLWILGWRLVRWSLWWGLWRITALNWTSRPNYKGLSENCCRLCYHWSLLVNSTGVSISQVEQNRHRFYGLTDAWLCTDRFWWENLITRKNQFKSL